MLNFIQDHPPGEIPDQPDRILNRGCQGGCVVQGEVLAPEAGGDALRERGLTGLPGSVEQHHRRIGKGLHHRLLNMSRKHGENIPMMW